MQDQHISPILSGLVILAAIATTFTTYSAYNEEKTVAVYEEAQYSLDQAAAVMVGIREARATVPADENSEVELEETGIELE